MMEKGFRGIVLILLAIVAGVSNPVIAAEIREVRLAATDTGTRVVVELSAPIKHKAFLLENPARVVLDLSKTSLPAELPDADALITALRAGALPHNGTRLVFEVKGPVTIQTSTLPATAKSAERLVLDINSPTAAKAAAVVPAPPAEPVAIRPAHAPSETGRDIVVAVDAGHGGVDPGASGRRGTHEKDVVLEIAKALAARINAEPGMKAVLTRDGDYFISLRERNLRAQKARAEIGRASCRERVEADVVAGRGVR